MNCNDLKPNFPLLFFSLFFIFELNKSVLIAGGTDRKKKKKKTDHLFKPGNQFSPRHPTKTEPQGDGASSAVDEPQPGPSGVNLDGGCLAPLLDGGGSAAPSPAPTADFDHEWPDLELEPVDLYPLETRHASAPETRLSDHEMRYHHQEKHFAAINKAIREHPPKCKDLQLAVGKELPWGICSKLSVRCKNCDYEQKELHKLYNEVTTPYPTTGRKAGAPNVAIQCALQDTTIYNTQLRLILNAMDLRPPSRSGMDKQAARVAKVQEEVARAGMRQRAREVAEKTGGELGASFDGWYDGRGIQNSRRTGEALSKTLVTFACETNTPNKYIIGQHVQTKLGPDANLHRFDSLTEKKAGEEIGRDLVNQGYTITEVTTDGDGRLCAGVASVSPTKFDHTNDPGHLGQTMIRKGDEVTWTEQMFPHVTLKGDRNKCTKALSIDLKNRCKGVLYALHKKHSKENKDERLKRVKKDIPHSVQSILSCYEGKCQDCSKTNTLCEGGEGHNNWIMQSTHLQGVKVTYLDPSNTDRKQLEMLISYFLSDEAAEKMKNLKDTQINEALNRSLSSVMPKNIKAPKTARGRVSRTAEKHNFGPGVASVREYTYLGVKVSKGQLYQFRVQQQQKEKQKAYVRDPVNKKKRYLRDAKTRMGLRAHRSKTTSDYEKGQHDHPTDHSYSVRKKIITFFLKCSCSKTCIYNCT